MHTAVTKHFYSEPGNLHLSNRVATNADTVVTNSKAVATNAEAVVSDGEAILTSAQAVLTSTQTVVRNGKAVVTNGEAVLSNGKAAVKFVCATSYRQTQKQPVANDFSSLQRLRHLHPYTTSVQPSPDLSRFIEKIHLFCAVP